MQKLDGNMIKKMITAGTGELMANKNLIDSMNVFPVPDGDTGSNMSMTIQSAMNEALQVEDNDASKVLKAASSGALRGARGNSGVILSQLFRGFAKGSEGKAYLGTEQLNECFRLAVDMAYKAVMKPKEGTIITVAKALADAAEEQSVATEEIHVFFNYLLQQGHEMLNKTKEMLPVLKEANVVDAGGKGLMCFLDGAYLAFSGKTYSVPEINHEIAEISFPTLQETDITYSYCTEFFVYTEEKKAEEELKSFLSNIGDSIVVVGDEDLIKVHVHTESPGEVLQKALEFGMIDRIKVDNMKFQHQHKIMQVQDFQELEEIRVENKKIGFVSVSNGKGLSEIFRSLGVDQIIEGGQSLNPSTEDILNAVKKVPADYVFVFPNNKNIILAAKQAAALSENKQILVVETRSIPQGITAMMAFEPDAEPDELLQKMTDHIRTVKSGEITFAVRDTKIKNLNIKKGDFIGLLEDEIILSEKKLKKCLYELLEEMIAEDDEVVTVYVGSEVTEQEETEMKEYLEKLYQDLELSFFRGDQHLYYFIVSSE